MKTELIAELRALAGLHEGAPADAAALDDAELRKALALLMSDDFKKLGELAPTYGAAMQRVARFAQSPLGKKMRLGALTRLAELQDVLGDIPRIARDLDALDRALASR